MNNNIREEWRLIEGHTNEYYISNLGRVEGPKGMRKNCVDKNGYYVIVIEKQNYRINRLVATYFINNKNNLPVVNHLDGNKQNNIYTNLEWCTYSKNMKHAYDLGLKQPICGSKHVATKLNEEIVKAIRGVLDAGISSNLELAQIVGVKPSTIWCIKNRLTWKHI